MKKKVLVVDDSALIRTLLTEIINSLDHFEVVDSASDPQIAAEKIIRLAPDIMTLDIEMPVMDGLTFLEKIMRLRPMPVLIFSSLSQKNSQLALRALDLGAVDYLTKPTRSISEELMTLKQNLQEKLTACAQCAPQLLGKKKTPVSATSSGPGAEKKTLFNTTDKVIAIGSSTGGTVALAEILSKVPANLPGIVIVQHMPAGFTKSFAERLNSETPFIVSEAQDQDNIVPGKILIAPGGRHLEVHRSGTRFYVRLHDGPAVNRFRPSVDVLFQSVANNIAPNALGIILTGMGDDGALGMKAMKAAGCPTWAQDQASCVVFGMPKRAIEQGGVDKILSLDQIAQQLLQYKL